MHNHFIGDESPFVRQDVTAIEDRGFDSRAASREVESLFPCLVGKQARIGEFQGRLPKGDVEISSLISEALGEKAMGVPQSPIRPIQKSNLQYQLAIR